MFDVFLDPHITHHACSKEHRLMKADSIIAMIIVVVQIIVITLDYYNYSSGRVSFEDTIILFAWSFGVLILLAIEFLPSRFSLSMYRRNTGKL